jgi:hypothetical protein
MHFFDTLLCHMEYVLVLKLSKEMVGFFLHYLINFFA